MADYEFKYAPLTGRLTGNQMIEQTEQAINGLAKLVDEAAGQVIIISTLANEANENAANALEVAEEALSTTGRTYITVSTQTDADNYYDSELIYIADSTSTNIPVADTGMLEAKTNDTKTACEQVFIADSSGEAYYRNGSITAETVGDVTTYTVSWGAWSSEPASRDYVQSELTNYLPLSGGTITGDVFAPTPAQTDDSTKIATTAYVKDCIPKSVGSANIPVYTNADGVITSTGKSFEDYAPLATPTFTGTPKAPTPGETDNSTKIATTEFVRTVVPAGVVLAYAKGAVPTGWLLCDGSAVSRTTYAALFAVIGTTYGAGNGSTTFNLPNLTNKFIQGNSTVGTVKSAGLPNITGAFRLNNLSSNYITYVDDASGAFSTSNSEGTNTVTYSTPQDSRDHVVTFSASNSNSIYGNSTTVQPPALTMKYIIKY